MTEEPSNPIGPLARSFNSNPATRGADHQQDSDAALIDRVLLRDQVAMTTIFDRYCSMVYSVALRVLKDPAGAEDVMQQIFF